MSRLASPALPPSGSTEAAPEQAGGMSLFGIRPSRLFMVPLRRWKLFLFCVVLCAAGAYLYATTVAETVYPIQGQFVYKPRQFPDEFKNIYTPLNQESMLAVVKQRQNYITLCDEFQFGFAPEVLSSMINVTKFSDEVNEVFTIKMEWEDPKDGVKLLTRLMQLTQAHIENLRKQAL